MCLAQFFSVLFLPLLDLPVGCPKERETLSREKRFLPSCAFLKLWPCFWGTTAQAAALSAVLYCWPVKTIFRSKDHHYKSAQLRQIYNSPMHFGISRGGCITAFWTAGKYKIQKDLVFCLLSATLMFLTLHFSPPNIRSILSKSTKMHKTISPAAWIATYRAKHS